MSGFCFVIQIPDPDSAHNGSHCVKCVMQTVAQAVDEVVTDKATGTHTKVPVNQRGIFHVG